MTSSLTVAISEDGLLRARVARLDSVAADALKRHQPAPLAAHALCRALGCAAVFPWEWKSEAAQEERVAIQWAGRGKIGSVVAEVRYPARLRVMVSRPDAAGLPLVDDHGHARNTGLSDGYVSVLSQDSSGRVTQGMVDLVDGQLDTDLEHYFVQSQQIATKLRTYVDANDPVAVLAVVTQVLPGAPANALAALDGYEKLTPTSSVQDALNAALGNHPVKILSTVTPEYWCGCHRDRIERTLRLLEVAVLEDMREKDKGAEITCEFCREVYAFDVDDLNAVLQDKRAAGATDIN